MKYILYAIGAVLFVVIMFGIYTVCGIEEYKQMFKRKK